MAYIAGIMDGDGSFTLGRRKNPKGVNFLYYPLVQFGSRSRCAIDFLNSFFNGYTTRKEKCLGKDGIFRNEFFFWKLEKSTRCLPFLKSIKDFLKIKKERCDLLIDYIENNPFKRGSVPLSSDVVERREEIYKKMRLLNDNPNSDIHSKDDFYKKNPSARDFSYIAGLMDTDGSFSIKKESLRYKGKSARHSPIISLSMIDRRGIDFLNRCFEGGSTFEVRAKTAKNGFAFRWMCGSKKGCIEFLISILPFLREKKERAKVLLEFCLKSKPTLHCRGGIKIEELEFRENCYTKIINLNKYGVYKPSLIDLEARQGDRAEGESHGERLSEMASKEDATV